MRVIFRRKASWRKDSFVDLGSSQIVIRNLMLLTYMFKFIKVSILHFSSMRGKQFEHIKLVGNFVVTTHT
jgi:hypothetical protein